MALVGSRLVLLPPAAGGPQQKGHTATPLEVLVGGTVQRERAEIQQHVLEERRAERV